MSFPHAWQAEILPQRPAILPQRHFTYPREAEEVERGALEVMVRPSAGAPFLATFALGFADRTAPSGLWSCPDPNALCALAGGYAYFVDTRDPERFTFLKFRPVLDVRPAPEQNLLLFCGSYAIVAWGAQGLAWTTGRLSWEGLRITEICDGELRGFGWDLMTDQEIPFAVNLATGQLLRGGIEP
ncbi:MAG TPA: hypothetical protein VJV22_07555 [Acidobacteriaceae bacterium]|nr:hypothetical protein [Acidobacteriaceae bacterium]